MLQINSNMTCPFLHIHTKEIDCNEVNLTIYHGYMLTSLFPQKVIKMTSH